jgi:hypothetical protein
VPRFRRVSDKIAPTIAVMVLVFPEPGGLCYISIVLLDMDIDAHPWIKVKASLSMADLMALACALFTL